MSILVKWKTENGWFFGYLNNETQKVTMPSGIKYPVDDDGNVIVNGKKYRLQSSTYLGGQNEPDNG